jgi:hypothetical protein
MRIHNKGGLGAKSFLLFNRTPEKLAFPAGPKLKVLDFCPPPALARAHEKLY